ncbi:CLUMA_CG003774, isoform A [Clunio marinus]|uniref:CLUMA_CG003774, isoform A n=1 Tax=Clunio marinus TaxID=568069 RepID=A0A1J1HPU1_9DIPT|nr:CLUMA_CG003774, isoform A [Clunio marinus]
MLLCRSQDSCNNQSNKETEHEFFSLRIFFMLIWDKQMNCFSVTSVNFDVKPMRKKKYAKENFHPPTLEGRNEFTSC